MKPLHLRLMDSPWPALVLATAYGLWGLGWGLPSRARAELLLNPSLRNEAFYLKIEKARSDYYEEIGNNPMAYVGRQARLGPGHDVPITILSSYSSFLVRTHHGDEQATLVMLSHLNPFQGRWYPYTYAYGGAYLYPLGIYVKCVSLTRLIHLIPQVSFYYAHPEEIAKVFWVVRSWSLIGLLVATFILFHVAKRLAGTSAAFWASCFFALLPVCLCYAKLAKPHTWAAAWTLASLYFCIRAREDDQLKWIVAASACLGMALGTAMSQAAFALFLLWACMSSDWKRTVQKVAIAACVPAVLFLITNFYLLAHLQDYRDEMYYLQRFYPFKVRLSAIWEFWGQAMPPSYGKVFWIVVMASLGYALIQKTDLRMRWLAGISCAISVYLAFQTQAQHGFSDAMRLCVALIGLGCVYVGWALSRKRWGNVLLGGLLGLLAVNAAFYDAHFASDRVPYDNASLASLWISKNVPKNSWIGQPQRVPHVTDFPPIDFTQYRIMTLRSKEFLNAANPRYAVIPSWDDDARKLLKDHQFVLVKEFAESPLQKRSGFDFFNTANFKLEIYQHS